jgi:uncharacterized membrane protein
MKHIVVANACIYGLFNIPLLTSATKEGNFWSDRIYKADSAATNSKMLQKITSSR